MIMPASTYVPLLMLLLGSSLSVPVSSSSSVEELSFTCPAQTTCPQVCSPTVADCPEELKCRSPEGSNETLQLCADGSCAVFCDPSLVSPCASTSVCSPVTCASRYTYYETCLEDYGGWYEFATECYGFEDDAFAEESSVEGGTITGLAWTNGVFVFVYCWVALMSVAIVHWCWFNHRICPVEGSTKLILTQEKDGTTRKTLQTGYKRDPVGTLLYGLTSLTFAGWFALQIYATHLYTNTTGDDKLMALRIFCASWVVGFCWNCTILWPHTIRSLFLRRCRLHEATHVAIFQEMDLSHTKDDNEDIITGFPALLQTVLEHLHAVAKALTTLLFANPHSRPDTSKGMFAICPVRHNPNDNSETSRHLIFLYRRHNFEKITGTFEPGSWEMGKTFHRLCPQGVRMSAIEEAEDALERILQMDLDASQALEHFPDEPATPTRPSIARRRNTSTSTHKSNKLLSQGLSTEQVRQRLAAVGPNAMEMAAPSFLGMLLNEIAKPFYLYQIYIVWIWVCIDYLYATVCIWVMVLITATIISWFRYRGQQVLYRISHVDSQATVLRDGEFSTVDQIELVPGDIVQLEAGVINCDMLLLTGETVVDESALTGECTPQAKSPIDPESRQEYDPAIHKKQTLSAGTNILECEDSLALVMKTASNTTKGELMRDVLVFRKHHLKFRKELPVAIAFLTTYSTLFFLIVLFTSSDELIIAWFLGMTAFSNAFPPLLPTTFIIPVGFAFERLARNGVACSNSDSILIAGQVDAAFFDKTGTLTQQGLNFISVRSAKSWNSGQWPSETTSMAMCVCHSLTISNTGTLIGNPVDQAMFASSGAKLIEASGVTASISSNNGNDLYKVIRRFDFDHNRMTQSVIVKQVNGTITVFAKGSGEAVSKLCDPSSVPDSFLDRLRSYSRNGVYQIAVATKELDLSPKEVAEMTRDQVEKDLQFAGVLNFANQLREDTPEVIKQLNEADIQSIMLTGDNLHTGINIARKSGIMEPKKSVIIGVLDSSDQVVWKNESDDSTNQPNADAKARERSVELAMSGEAWQVLLRTQKDYAIALAPFIRVFGRCSPLDKVSVVDTFTSLGFTTMMCGDGGNDCGALRAAHIGLALSDSEASIVAPLTSLGKDITDVLKVLKEGRGSMASTIAAYKYVILYGNTSSYCQLIMYYLSVSFSDWMWLFTDVIWTVIFALTLPLAKPANVLSKTRPTSSLLSLQTVGGIVGIIAMNYVFTTVALTVLYNEDWFQCRKWQVDDVQAGSILSASDNYEISVVFLMVGWQLISAAAAVNFGYEYRQAWYRNYAFASLWLGYAIIHIFITLKPGSLSCLWRINCDNDHVVRGVLSSEPAPIGNPYNSTIMPMEFRLKLLGIMLANGACVVGYEYFVVNGWWQRKRFSKELAEPPRIDESILTLGTNSNGEV